MKRIAIALIVSTLLVSCSSYKRCSKLYPCGIGTNTETKIVDRLVEIPAVQDSGSLDALFECDSNNKVILKDFNQLWSRYVSVVSALEADSLGRMKMTLKVNTNHPATQAKVTNSTITQDKLIYLPGAPYPVEKKLNWIQQTLMYSGMLVWFLIIIYIAFKLFNPIKKLLP